MFRAGFAAGAPRRLPQEHLIDGSLPQSCNEHAFVKLCVLGRSLCVFWANNYRTREALRRAWHDYFDYGGRCFRARLRLVSWTDDGAQQFGPVERIAGGSEGSGSGSFLRILKGQVRVEHHAVNASLAVSFNRLLLEETRLLQLPHQDLLPVQLLVFTPAEEILPPT